MKATSKTTMAGTSAGALFAAAQVPGVPPTLHLALNLGAALALVFLGHHAAECPANCPGTDALKRPRPWQQTLLMAFGIVLASVLVASALTGCVAANPNAGPTAPAEPAFVVSPSLATWSNAVVAAGAAASAPTGLAAPVAQGLAGIFAAIGAISVAWARHKSKVASTLADGIAAQGPSTVIAVQDATSTRTKSTAVRETLTAAQIKRQKPS